MLLKKEKIFFLILVISNFLHAQKDSLKLGDKYAEDQIYLSISYAQLFNQPTKVTESKFSYNLSVGFIKDLTFTEKGNISFAAGLGYGYSYFNHNIRVDKVNDKITFNKANNVDSNIFKVHNLELPIELRWRTSNANKYSFWRIYSGVKFQYNLSNRFEYIDTNNQFSFKDIKPFSNLQYGLTFSLGYDEFNINIFYALTPIFKNSKINDESINSRILKIGLIFYIL